MKIVVIAGQGRKVGKTAVAARLIRSLRRLNWVAVKISTHRQEIAHLEAEDTQAGSSGYILTEETSPSSSTDTGRFLAAGARRAFWLRTSRGALPAAVTSLLSQVGNEEHVMVESNSILPLIAPQLVILVTNSKRRARKSSFQRALADADAVVEVGHPSARRLPRTVRRFRDSNRAIDRFVLLRLRGLNRSQFVGTLP
jgi:molybdopterin-guanine dinucleotide biosynthesis protein